MSEIEINTYIKLEDTPNFVDKQPSEFGIPSEELIGLGSTDGLDNQYPMVADPVNWMIFDCGEYDPIDFMPEDSSERINPKLSANKTPWYMRHIYVNNDLNTGITLTDPSNVNYYTYVGRLVANNPGAKFPEMYTTHFEFSHFFKNNGPRDKGYMKIDERSWIRVNNYTATGSPAYDPRVLKNEAWRSGSIEFTIRPEKANCTLLSGQIWPEGRTTGSIQGTVSDSPGKQIALTAWPDGTTDGQRLQFGLQYGIGQGEETAYPESKVWVVSRSGGPTLEFNDERGGATLTSIRHTFRTFKVDLVDGRIRVSYEIFYGENKKYIEFFSETNILDGDWHHVIINRPSRETVKYAEQLYDDAGCIEIWIDGKLDARSFEITENDVLPTPNILFNDGLNPGIINWSILRDRNEQAADWLDTEWAKTGYAGDIRDFIFRQSKALSNHEISLNYIYAMLNTETSKVLKAKNVTAAAQMIAPVVTTSKPKVLKLYWNNLLKNKEKMLNGLEFDDTYDVYSYSVTHKNLISSSQTFNLDLNDPLKERKYLQNVRAAVGKNMFTKAPNLLMTATDEFPVLGGTTGFTGSPIMIDVTNDARIVGEAIPYPWHINNMQFGGVELKGGDRVLLFNQHKKNDNGIWVYTGPDTPMLRADDADISVLENAHVYVEQGKYAGKTFVQTRKVTHTRKSAQIWREIDTNASSTTIESYPIHTTPWYDLIGDKRFINVNTDIEEDFDIIAFMNYPTQSSEIIEAFNSKNEVEVREKYKEFMDSLKLAVSNGKRLFVSSPLLVLDLGIVDEVAYVPQILQDSGDEQSASISPFESGEPAENYFDTHRNNKYQVVAEVAGLTDKETYIMSDFVTYSPNRINSDYHIKYNYRQFGLQEGDEFLIPGLTTLPETLNGQLPGYLYNQKGIKDLAVFPVNSVNMGTIVTQLSNIIYDGDTPVNNPYDDYATTIAVNYGSGKIFVNCVENTYAFSRSDYNVGRVQNVTAGENAETIATAAWQYSTKRLNKKNLYDFSDASNLIGQTTPTNGGGGGFVQAQSHCSDGLIRAKTNKDDLRFQSDLYPDFTEEYFSTTEIPTLSMTWLGLKWLAE